jgi:peptide/nickel transport system substrate-binding protein
MVFQKEEFLMKKPTVSKKYMEKIHPYIPELYSKYAQGRVSRREFMRMATLLGMSAGIATIAAQCGGAAQPAAAPTESSGGEQEAASSGEEQPAAEESSGAIQRGGTWTSSMQLQLLDHPARLSWVEGANIVRQIGEYLTETGPDNITRPYLLDRWEASDDVATWDLYLKQGIKFNNGDELTADDVMFTFGEWLNPDVGS